jgi:hypothetical protein
LLVTFWLQLKDDKEFLRYRRFELVSELKDHKKSLWPIREKRNIGEFDYLKAQVEVE